MWERFHGTDYLATSHQADSTASSIETEVVVTLCMERDRDSMRSEGQRQLLGNSTSSSEPFGVGDGRVKVVGRLVALECACFRGGGSLG